MTKLEEEIEAKREAIDYTREEMVTAMANQREGAASEDEEPHALTHCAGGEEDSAAVADGGESSSIEAGVSMVSLSERRTATEEEADHRRLLASVSGV